MTADDDARGGEPACFLDEVDPAYAGYLIDAEVDRFLAALLARERAALATARALGADADAFAAAAAMLADELARRPRASDASPDARFAAFADSPPTQGALAALETELIGMLEATLPRIASNALHDALNRALARHRAQRARRAVG
jgi:hypothetical protein